VSGRTAWAVAAGVAVAAVVGANLTGALVGVFYDDGIYLALARSLAEGHGYRLLYLPGAPAAVHYPFLYPLFLAALWKLDPSFPANVALFQGANAVLLGAFAALLVLYLRRSLGGRTWAWAALVAGSATVLPLVIVGTVLYSEPLFLVLAVGACWVGDAARSASSRRHAWVLALLAGLLAGSATLTRSVGMALVVAVPLSLTLARRPRAAAAAAAAAVACLAPWLLWVARHHPDLDPALVANYGTYTDLLRQAGWGSLSPVSIADLLRPLGAVGLALFHGWLRFCLGVPALIVLVAGFRPLIVRAPALGWTVLGYLAEIVAWPVRPDRFVWAIWPVLSVIFVLGAARLWRRLAGDARTAARLGRWCVAGTVVIVAAAYAFYQVHGYVRGDATRLQKSISASFAPVLPWIRQSTPPDAVIAVEDEAHVWLYTGRRAVPSYLWRYRGRDEESLGPDSMRAWLDREAVSYVVLTGAGSAAAPTLNALLGRDPGYLRVLRVWPGSIVAFTVDRAGATRAGASP
jgi:hypothetical protein